MPQFVSDTKAVEDKFKEFVDWKEPDNLYHYTSIESVAAILTSKRMRATHRYHLSDKQDVIHGMDRTISIVEDWECRSTEPRLRTMRETVLSQLRKEQSDLEVSPFTYSVSFSERCEGAAQWQVYGGYGRGVMIEFDFQELKQVLRDVQCWADDDPMKLLEAHFVLCKVTYCSDRQAQDVRALLDTAWDSVQSANDIYPNPAAVRVGRATAFWISSLGIRCYKSPAFDSEAEWRAVPHVSSVDLVEFHSRGGILRPYIPMSLDARCIKRIVIGSAVNDPLARNALSLFVKKQGLGHIKIDRSEVELVPPG